MIPFLLKGTYHFKLSTQSGDSPQKLRKTVQRNLVNSFSSEPPKKYGVEGLATDDTVIGLVGVTGRCTCTISFFPGFHNRGFLVASLCFLNRLICFAGVLLYDSSYLVLHV